jgi:hypothetical protein
VIKNNCPILSIYIPFHILLSKLTFVTLLLHKLTVNVNQEGALFELINNQNKFNFNDFINESLILRE